MVIINLATMILVQHRTAHGLAKTGLTMENVIVNGMFGGVQDLLKKSKTPANHHAICVVSELIIHKLSFHRLLLLKDILT